MKTEKYAHCTNDTDPNRYDVFEIGGEIVAKSVKFHLVDSIVDFLNKEEEKKQDSLCSCDNPNGFEEMDRGLVKCTQCKKYY